MNRGFTLTELLVVISVITIMTLVVYPNWREGQRSLAVERAAQRIAQDIRKTSEYALSGRKLDSFGSGLACPSGSLSGYGLAYLDIDWAFSPNKTKYIIFGECSGDNEFSGSTDVYVEVIELESGIQVMSGSRGSVVFIPPRPEVYHSVGAPNSVIKIQATASPTLQKVIQVNKAGVIEIQ